MKLFKPVVNPSPIPMARLYSHRRGRSGSSKPMSKVKPEWVQLPAAEVERLTLSLAREGRTKSQIGLELRDRYGIPSVKLVTGKSITAILKEAKEQAMEAEDLTQLMKKVDRMKRHSERYPSDHLNVHTIQLVSSKVRRLAKYYKEKGILPPDWKYEA